MNINVLGVNYSVVEGTELQYPKLKNCNGYCDETVNEIVVDNYSDNHNEMAKANLEKHKKKVLRHELIHAFLMESGLGESWNNEEFVDWIAYQFPKLAQAFKDAHCLE